MDALSQLEPRQRAALEAMLRGASRQEAAGEAGVTPRTLFSWRQSQVFQQALLEVQRQLLQDAYGDLKAGAREAVATLRQIVSDAAAPPSTRVRAAVAILELGLRLQEIVEIDERLNRLEEQIAPRPDRPNRPCAA